MQTTGQILHDELRWFDVPDQVFFKLAVTVHLLAANDITETFLSQSHHEICAVKDDFTENDFSVSTWAINSQILHCMTFSVGQHLCKTTALRSIEW